MHFILSFVMLYIENIGLQDCVFRVLANRVTYSINTLVLKGLGKKQTKWDNKRFITQLNHVK